ncbi:MAG: Methylene-tetrahydromethanopterin dehydrogenase, N-terminal [Planctomycetota bacterium]|nr:Methylene-tetrahydromethanopterin dehydrogenase, N-terminal [Planctomycetota bacterium]
MKPTILLQLDTDPQPSVFDGVVAVDSGVAHIFRHGGVKPEAVRDLVHGALFTRGPADLKSTAVFVGGSDVRAGESLLKAVTETFFGPFRVSVLFDANGCNTTAAAAVLAAIEGATRALGSIDGATVAVLAATGPVGQRVARLLLGLEGSVSVRVGSRRLDKAQATAALLKQTTGKEPVPFATANVEDLKRGIAGADVVIAAGAAGVMLLPAFVRESFRPKVLVDLNAVPPVGIEGVDPTDRGKDRGGVLTWGALGVGGTKMKIHKKALQELFTANDKRIDAEECLAIGRSLE